MAGKYTAADSGDAGTGERRYGDADMTIPDLLGLDNPEPYGPEAGARGRRSDRAPGRHAAPKRSFLRRKAARFRARKAVPAAAIAATLAAGAAAYGIAGAGTPGETAASLATVPPGGYRLAAGGALAAGGPGASSTAGSGTKESANASGGFTGALASSMLQSQRMLADAAKRAAAAHAAAQPAATSSPAASRPAATPAPATSRPAATPAPTSSKSSATSLTCHASSGLLPENVTAIVSFLLAHGYSDNAAAGIAGNIYQESKGNPESVGDGGGGLIGWTPLPAGYVTGNPAADLQAQLSGILTFNQQWAQYLPELDDAATAADAASIYVTDFERAGIPAASTREAAAQAVASACGI